MSAADRLVLVTGSTGFIGTQVVNLLRARGEEVVELRHRWNGLDELRCQTVGVTDCIHLGWYADPRDYLSSVAENRASFDASLELLHALATCGCRSLVVAGSQAEYAQSDQLLTETGPIAPWSVYGALKASFRLVATSSAAPPTLGVAWARLFNVVGPGEHPGRLVPAAACALLDGRPMDLSPGDQVRDYIDIDDAATALVHLHRERSVGTFNVSTGEGTTLRALLSGLAERLGRPELLRFGARPYGDHDPLRSVGTNARLVGTGWARQHPVEGMLDRIASYWSSQPRSGPPGLGTAGERSSA